MAANLCETFSDMVPESFKIKTFTSEVDWLGCIDSAYLNNLEYIYILHGTGTGALKEAIHSYLKLQKNVKTFNFAKPENGGYGMTEATLK